MILAFLEKIKYIIRATNRFDSRINKKMEPNSEA